jgi:hypothetical protein
MLATLPSLTIDSDQHVIDGIGVDGNLSIRRVNNESLGRGLFDQYRTFYAEGSQG